MGSCFSSDSSEFIFAPSTAKVISADGNLREYPMNVTISQVLKIETSPCFLCSSDGLLIDDYIPALDSSEELQPGQMYFVLPINRLQYRLTPPDMAALAVKASNALAQGSKKKGQRNKKIRISPLFQVNNQEFSNGGYGYNGFKNSGDKSKIGVSRSGHSMKLQRSASKQTNFGIQSFPMRLSTIYEGSEIHGGSLQASDDFPADRFLVEPSASSAVEEKEGFFNVSYLRNCSIVSKNPGCFLSLLVQMGHWECSQRAPCW